MTNRMPLSCARSPAHRNPSNSGADSPMRNRLSCSSLPRLRSQPIQRCSLSLHERPRWKRKKRPGSVPAIQFLDPAGHDVDILCVLRHALPRCVSKIGQERKAQICIGISEVTNFETVKFVLDCVRGGQQHRHHHQRAAIIRNAFFFEGHFRQDLRRQKRGHEIIHGQHRQLARRQEQQKCEAARATANEPIRR